MIQAATGKTYAEALKEQVLTPLGLDSTSLPEGIEMPEPVLRGYDLDPPNPPEDVTEQIAAGWSWASGGIVSTPEDMNDFIRGYVGGKLFGPQTQAQQTDLFIPGGESGPPGPGVNSVQHGAFPLRNPVRRRLRAHRQHPRVHPIRGRQPGRDTVGHDGDDPGPQCRRYPGRTPGAARTAAGRGGRDLPGAGRFLTNPLEEGRRRSWWTGQRPSRPAMPGDAGVLTPGGAVGHRGPAAALSTGSDPSRDSAPRCHPGQHP